MVEKSDLLQPDPGLPHGSTRCSACSCYRGVLFCEVCGKLCTLVEPDKVSFDPLTGEKRMKPVCPSGICGHEGVSHDFTLTPQEKGSGLIKRFFTEVFYFLTGGNPPCCTQCGAQAYNQFIPK